MRTNRSSHIVALAVIISALVALAGCSSPDNGNGAETAPAAAAARAAGERAGRKSSGRTRSVANWPQPLPDGPDGVKHEGWTWGSIGAMYAETPDRIWIAQRGELPLPADAKPWTPYGLLNPTRGNATGNTDGLNAECEPADEARMGAAVAPFRVRRGSRRQARRRVAAPRKDVRSGPRAAAARTRSR